MHRRPTTFAGLAAAIVLFICAASVATVGIAVARDLTKTARPVTAARRSTKATAKPAVTAAQRALTAAMIPVARNDSVQVAVAAENLTTGAQTDYAGTKEFVTA